MNKTIAYKRVSSDEQLDGHSMDHQDEQIRMYCQLYKLDLVEIIQDEGLSGRKTEGRPGFLRMMDMVAKKEVDHVVTLSFTRFARNTMDTITSLDKMAKSNVAFHSISERIETTGAYGKFMTTLFAALSQLESDKIGERVKSVKKFCKANSRTYTKPLLGYDNNTESGELVPNEKELLVVKKIFDLTKQNTSQNKIAEYLNEQSVPTKEGKNWHQSTVRYVINNPIYKPMFIDASYLSK